MSKQVQPAPTASAVGPYPTLIQISRTPRHGKFTQHHRKTHDHPTTPRYVSCIVVSWFLELQYNDTRLVVNSHSPPVWPHTFVSPSADSRGTVVNYWRKYVHKVLVNRLECLSLPRKSLVKLTDRLDMTLDVYRRRKTTTQQQQ